MTETPHQVFRRRAGRGSKSLAGVTKIVEPETRQASPLPGPVKRLAHSVTTHRTPITANEHPIRPGPGGHVLSQHRQDMRRDRHASFPRIGLGLSVERDTGREQLDPVPPDGHYACRKIDIITAQPEQFTPAKTAPRSQQHCRTVSGSDCLDQGDDLGR